MLLKTNKELNKKLENCVNTFRNVGSIKTGFPRLNDADKIKVFSKQYTLWLKNLTSEEYVALFEYIDHAYLNINSVLRGREENYIEDNKNHAKFLHQALSKAKIHQDITVYRGVSKSTLGKYRDLDSKQLVGKVIHDPGFMSTSLSSDSIPNNSISLIIKVPKGSSGAYIGNISRFNTENEVLLNKGQRLVITTVIDDDKNNTKLICEIV